MGNHDERDLSLGADTAFAIVSSIKVNLYVQLAQILYKFGGASTNSCKLGLYSACSNFHHAFHLQVFVALGAMGGEIDSGIVFDELSQERGVALAAHSAVRSDSRRYLLY